MHLWTELRPGRRLDSLQQSSRALTVSAGKGGEQDEKEGRKGKTESKEE